MSEILRLDQRIFESLNSLTNKVAWFDAMARFVAVWFVYAIPLILVGYWFLHNQKEKLVALRVTFFGLFGWLAINNLIGFFWFRKRPFVKLIDAKELIFHQPDKSFPSDHATLGFALAIGFMLAGYKKTSYFFLVWTTIFSIARVIVGVHFPLDIIAGFLVGGVVALVGHLVREPFDRYIGSKLVRLARLVRLA